VWKSLQNNYEPKSHGFVPSQEGVFQILPLKTALYEYVLLSLQFPSSPFPLPHPHFSSLVYVIYITKTKLIWLMGVVDPKPTGKNKRVNRWGWTGHYLMKIFKWVLFSSPTFSVWGLQNLPYTTTSLQKKLQGRGKKGHILPRDYEISTYMYVILARPTSSWNFLWLKLEWKVLWTLLLPLLLSSLFLQVFQFSTPPSSMHQLALSIL